MSFKSDLIDQLVGDLDLTKKQAGEAVEGVFGRLSETLAGGERVQVPGFGTFSISERAEREGAQSGDRQGDDHTGEQECSLQSRQEPQRRRQRLDAPSKSSRTLGQRQHPLPMDRAPSSAPCSSCSRSLCVSVLSGRTSADVAIEAS